MKNFKNKIVTTSLITLGGVSSFANTHNINKDDRKPNFIIIFADDLGYGDIGVYGNPNIRTPNLDKMANEGQKWTNYYVAASVSTPSRAGLLTGRLPVRSGMCSHDRRVLFPNSNGGLPSSEITIAKALKTQGYHTAAIGKWHLGHKSPFLPTDHGFDTYFGIPYSNDMDKIEQADHFQLAESERYEAYNVPLMRDKQIIERPADQRTITKRYTEEAVSKIKQLKKESFFIYLAHSMPHIPLFRSESFKDKSKAGIYGDVIEELDWSVGQILQTLKEEGLDENTFVIFTSDNGPWKVFRTHGGSSGPLRGQKGGTYEGGMRVPCIMWWPGTIKPNVIMDLGTTMDIMPTFCNLAGIELPKNRVYDGYDLSSVIFKQEQSPRDIVYYYRGTDVYAIRKGKYKIHFITQPEYGEGSNDKTFHNPPLLYNIDDDPSEMYNISSSHPEIVAEMREILTKHIQTVITVENQLEK